MGSFIKYPKIVNYHFPESDFAVELAENSEELAIITEKIDGCNVQFVLRKGDPEIDVCSRSQVLGPEDDLYGLWDFLAFESLNAKTVLAVLHNLQKIIEDSLVIESINIYGEFFGPGIQNRINYGDEKKIYFFDMRINGKFVSPDEFYTYMRTIEGRLAKEEFVYDHFVAPILAVTPWEDAVSFDTSIQSKISPNQEIIEGIVIKPYKYHDFDRVLKIKNADILFSRAHRRDYSNAKKVLERCENARTSGLVPPMKQVFLDYGKIADETQVIRYTKEVMTELFKKIERSDKALFNRFNGLQAKEKKFIKKALTKNIRQALYEELSL